MDESLTSDFMFFKEIAKITLSSDIGSLKISQVRNNHLGFFQSFKVKVYELSFRIIERSHTDNFSMHYSYSIS